MKLIIAIGVPYHVEIAASGIPLHEAKVEFCIPKNDVSFNFPAKAITDNEYVFTVTDAIKEFINTTIQYKLYVYYGNARFEADAGSFNLVDKTTFEVEMKPKEKSLAEKIYDKTKRRPKTETPETTKKVKEKKEVKTTPTVTNEVTETPTETKVDTAVKVKATKPTPTPTIEPTTTLKEAKDAIKNKKKVGSKSGLAKILVTDTPAVEETMDANTRVKDILQSINKTVTPNADLATVAVEDVEVTKTTGNFLVEVEKMREAQEKIKATKITKAKEQRVKDAIKKSTEPK